MQDTGAFEMTDRQEEKKNRAAVWLLELSVTDLGSAQGD